MNIKEIPCLWERLRHTSKPIVLFGTGDGGDKIINALGSYGLKISGVFCSDYAYREKYFHGYKVMKYSDAKAIFGNMVVLMAFGSDKHDVLRLAMDIEKEQEFYVPDVPIFGDGLFNGEFFSRHKHELEEVYDKLADKHSKTVFEQVVNFKLSGKPEYIYSCETDNNEAFENILKLSSKENFLDLGAYDGDTINEFINYAGDYLSITALEPDRKNFKKLKANTSGIPHLSLYNAASGSHCGTTVFDCKGGRSSYVTEKGKEQVQMMTVDSLEKDFTYIKMDVEGNELETIIGAKNTIASHKPKMLISAYHKNEDMFAIPKLVLSINPDYKIYMRHYKYLPAWDTNFYFV